MPTTSPQPTMLHCKLTLTMNWLLFWHLPWYSYLFPLSREHTVKVEETTETEYYLQLAKKESAKGFFDDALTYVFTQ